MQNPTRNVLLALVEYKEQIVASIADYAREQGWLLEEAHRGVGLAGWFGDGIITDFLTWEHLAAVRDVEQTPIVARNYLSGPLVRNVCADPDDIARLALNHFLARGFQHFASYCKDVWLIDSATAFDEQVRGLGLRAERFRTRERVGDGDYGVELAALVEWIAALPRPCALFLGENDRAPIIYRACALAGCRIPDDIAIVSNAEEPRISCSLTPQLSTVADEHIQIGLIQARLLTRMMNGESPAMEPVRPGRSRVIVRASSDALAVGHAPTRAAVRYLIDHADQAIDVPAIARAAGLQPRALHDAFQRELGQSPAAYLRGWRLARCRDMLRETDQTLDVIADQVGYGSGMALSLAFKRAFGETPGAFRRACRSQA